MIVSRRAAFPSPDLYLPDLERASGLVGASPEIKDLLSRQGKHGDLPAGPRYS